MLLVCELHFGEQGSIAEGSPVSPTPANSACHACSHSHLLCGLACRRTDLLCPFSVLRPGTKHEGKAACSQGAMETPRTGARGFWCFQKHVSGGHSVLGPLVTWGLLNTQIPGP